MIMARAEMDSTAVVPAPILSHEWQHPVHQYGRRHLSERQVPAPYGEPQYEANPVAACTRLAAFKQARRDAERVLSPEHLQRQMEARVLAKAAEMAQQRGDAARRRAAARAVRLLLRRSDDSEMRQAMQRWGRTVALLEAERTARRSAAAEAAARVAAADSAAIESASQLALQQMRANAALQQEVGYAQAAQSKALAHMRLRSAVRAFHAWCLMRAWREWCTLPSPPSMRALLAERDAAIGALRLRLSTVEAQLAEQIVATARATRGATAAAGATAKAATEAAEAARAKHWPPAPSVASPGGALVAPTPTPHPAATTAALSPRTAEQIWRDGLREGDDAPIDLHEYCALATAHQPALSPRQLPTLFDAIHTWGAEQMDHDGQGAGREDGVGARAGRVPWGRILLSDYILWALREDLSRGKGKVIDLVSATTPSPHPSFHRPLSSSSIACLSYPCPAGARRREDESERTSGGRIHNVLTSQYTVRAPPACRRRVPPLCSFASGTWMAVVPSTGRSSAACS
jgi:hypothetical protein